MQDLEVGDEFVTENVGHGVVVIVRAAEGFGHDFINEAQLVQIVGGDLQRLGGLRSRRAVLPQNCRTTFRTDDRVIGVFQNQRAIAHPDAQSTAAAALANHHGNHRHAKERHFTQVNGDGLGDVAFLCGDAGVGASGVDQANDRQLEPVSHAHDAQGLAVAFGMGATKVALDVFLGVAAFLCADNHHAIFAKHGKASHDCVVIMKEPVTVQLGKAAESFVNVIERVRPLRMPRELHALPSGEVRVNLAFLCLQLFLKLANLIMHVHIHLAVLRVLAEILQLAVEVNERFLEIQQMFHRPSA